MDEEELFTAAIEYASREEREAYLERVCSHDPALRRRVLRLASAHFEPEPFFDHPPEELVPLAEPSLAELAVGDRVGPYQLIELLGEGGVGLVYRAEQTAPLRRVVALKVIKPGMDTRQVVARFERERDALTRMDHPHICRVLDAGATPAGRPYFVMEYVAGGAAITRYCDEHRLGLRRRLELFVTVCRAVQHAHQKGVMHRDLKPSNVLVASGDEGPLCKVIDFGIAKAIGADADLDASRLTHLPQWMGTPAYMSPEQTEGHDVDSRTDVYSLGVLLYELIVGATPFGTARPADFDVDELRRAIREDEPKLPSQRLASLTGESRAQVAAARSLDPRRLLHALSRELDWIVAKALAKSPDRRYGTPDALADDIQRHLDDLPVEARRPSTLYAAWKLYRRHRTTMISIGASALTLLACVVGLLVANRRIAASREQLAHQGRQLAAEQADAERREREVRRHLLVADLQLAARAEEAGDLTLASERLDSHWGPSGPLDQADPGFPWHYLRGLCDARPRVLPGHEGAVFDVACSPDGRWLATAGHDRRVIVRRIADGVQVATLGEFGDDVNSVSFSADGRWLATGEEDRRARVWEWESGREIARFEGFRLPVANVFLTADNQLVASEIDWRTHEEARITLWDVAQGGLVGQIEGFRALAIHEPTGRVAGCDAGGQWGLWSLPELRRVAEWQGTVAKSYCAAFSPDGSQLAVGTAIGSQIDIWHTEFNSRVGLQRRLDFVNQLAVRDLAFTGDGAHLVAVTDNQTCLIWTLDDGFRLSTLQPGHGRLWSLAIHPRDTSLLLSNATGTVLTYAWAELPRRRSLVFHDPAGPTLACNRRGDRLAVLAGRKVTFHNLDTTERQDARQTTLPAEGYCLTFAEDEDSVWVGDVTGGILRVSPTGAIADDAPLALPRPVVALTISPAGRVAAATDTVVIALFDKLSPRSSNLPRIEFPAPEAFPWRLAGFLDDETLLLGIDTDLTFWDVGAGRRRPDSLSHDEWVLGVAVSPDRQMLATNTRSTTWLWELPARRLRGKLLGGIRDDSPLAFSPDGRWLAAATLEGNVEIWDVATRQLVSELRGHAGHLRQLEFSEDGRELVSIGLAADGGVGVLRWSSTGERQPAMARQAAPGPQRAP